MIELIEFTITRKHGTRHKLSIEIDYDDNSINVPASGELVGQANITAFMDAIGRAVALLALRQESGEAKKNDE